MHLTPRENDKLLIYMMSMVAQRRKDAGLKLNHPEAVSLIAAAALDNARAGKTVEEVMELARKTITTSDVITEASSHRRGQRGRSSGMRACRAAATCVRCRCCNGFNAAGGANSRSALSCATGWSFNRRTSHWRSRPRARQVATPTLTSNVNSRTTVAALKPASRHATALIAIALALRRSKTRVA